MRKIQEIGLQNQYKQNTDQLKSFICRTAALAFVPICFVHLSWQRIKADTPELPRIDEFIAYFETTWIAGTFHTADWNLYETEGLRSNNHLEGWHNRLQRVVGKSHPNIFECVEVFQREQVSTEVLIQQLAAGECPSCRKKRAIEKDQHIKELKERFSTNIISSSDYVAGVFQHNKL